MERVYYCLPAGHSIKIPNFIKDDKDVVFHAGIPDFNRFTNGKPQLLILDDLMNETDSDIMSLFTRQSHHRNLCVVFLVQNVFFGANKFFRTISLNCHYILCTKNPRDRKQISTLASQLYPENINFVKESFSDATQKAYSYLLFDLSQKCRDIIRFRTNIFPTDRPRNIIYVPVKKKKLREK